MTQSVHNNYQLSIRFTPDGFYLSVFDNNLKLSDKKIDAEFNHLTENQIIDILENQPEFQTNYKSVRLISETRHYTFVPDILFSETEMTHYFNFQHNKIRNEDTLLYNYLEAWEAVCIFSTPVNLNNVLRNFLPEITTEHHLTAFMNDHVAMQSGKSLYIFVRNKEIDCVVLHDNKLILVKTFDFESPEDITYHALNITTQLELGTDECQLTLIGNGNQSAYKEILTKYFRNCKTTELSC